MPLLEAPSKKWINSQLKWRKTDTFSNLQPEGKPSAWGQTIGLRAYHWKVLKRKSNYMFQKTWNTSTTTPTSSSSACTEGYGFEYCNYWMVPVVSLGAVWTRSGHIRRLCSLFGLFGTCEWVSEWVRLSTYVHTYSSSMWEFLLLALSEHTWSHRLLGQLWELLLGHSSLQRWVFFSQPGCTQLPHVHEHGAQLSHRLPGQLLAQLLGHRPLQYAIIWYNTTYDYIYM